MNKKLISTFVCMLLISTVGITVGLGDTTRDTQRRTTAMPLEPETPIIRDIKPIIDTNDFSPLPADTQVSFASEDETHLSCAIEGNGNPFVVFDKAYDISTSTLVTQFSPDKGATWPEELQSEWNFEDTYAINPDISMLSDGIAAFGTYELQSQDPQVNMLWYPDIADTDTWEITYFDNTDSSTYVAETAAATKGENTVAIANLCDYDNGQDYYESTILINWNCFRGEDSWPGVYYRNTQPLSHLTGDAGEKIFFCVEQEGTNGLRSIKAYYCNVTEATIYSDWDSGTAAGGRSNCTYPDVSVSGKLAYCVYMDDKNGSQDVYVATTSSGTMWKKYVVADSEDDELYPVISANGNDAICMFIKNNDLYVTTSEDAGVTWSDPVKVNDDTGSVIAEYGSSDIISAYGFWASNREGNNDIFFEEVGKFADVVIDEVAGGLGIRVSLSNIGNADAVDVPWRIVIDGRVFVGSEKSGTVSLSPGASTTVSTGLIVGFGPITITITVGTVTKTAEAKLLLFFVTGL